jgi:hypothetical protein
MRKKHGGAAALSNLRLQRRGQIHLAIQLKGLKRWLMDRALHVDQLPLSCQLRQRTEEPLLYRTRLINVRIFFAFFVGFPSSSYLVEAAAVDGRRSGTARAQVRQPLDPGVQIKTLHVCGRRFSGPEDLEACFRAAERKWCWRWRRRRSFVTAAVQGRGRRGADLTWWPTTRSERRGCVRWSTG